MPMADGEHTLRKVAFQLGDQFFRFAVNPENLIYSRPHRTTAIKTKSRIVVEDFGADIPIVTLSGSTGFNPTGNSADKGINKIRKMKKFIIDYADSGGNGDKGPQDFYFHDFTNGESYVVHLSAEGVNYTQDVNSPLTHRYDIKFTILREASKPAEDDVVTPEIGNRFPSIPKGSGGWQPIDPYSPELPDVYDPSSGNDNVYKPGTSGEYVDPYDGQPINPQAPSPISYYYGTTGLGYSIGYYGRGRGMY